MDDKDEQIRQMPAPDLGASALRERIEPLCALSARHAQPRLNGTDRARLRRALRQDDEADGGEARRRRYEALRELRRLALDVAQGAADSALRIDARVAALNERVREAARELSRDSSRPLHERMLLIGLWAPAAAEQPRREMPAQVVRRRRAAARVRRARGRG